MRVENVKGEGEKDKIVRWKVNERNRVQRIRKVSNRKTA